MAMLLARVANLLRDPNAKPAALFDFLPKRKRHGENETQTDDEDDWNNPVLSGKGW